MVRGVQKIRAFYVRIALLIMRMKGGGVDAGVNFRIGGIARVKCHVAGDAAESSPK